MKKVNIPAGFDKIDQLWDPHVAGDVNDSQVKIAKIHGEFDWHTHEKEDEAFFVMKGRFVMEMRDQSINMGEGDFLVIPRGVEHRPVAIDECWIMLVEPASTLNTGGHETEKTKHDLKRL